MKYIKQIGIVLLSIIVMSFAWQVWENDRSQAEWISLFNGENLDHWTAKIHHYESGDNYANTFRAEDGIIKIRYDQYEGDFNNRFGHLNYDTPFSYFHLKFEYRFIGELHPGAPSYTLRNSGIMFHSQDPRSMLKEQNWPISVEFQLLGGLDDGKARPTGNMCSPGTKVVYKGKVDDRHCINSSSATYDGDQWVKGELIVLGDSLITHIIEGDTVLKYSQPMMSEGVVAGYDPDVFEEGKLMSEGFISLQSEGQPVDFRNLQLMDLSANK